jgi:hypothetical protein
MKKITSIALIIFITTLLGGLVSYVRAAYIEPLGGPAGNNAPAPVLTSDVTSNGFGPGEKGFLKIGKLGITSNSGTNPVDANQFNSSSLVVMGQTSADSFTSSYSNRIRAELPTSSQLFPLYVGDPVAGTLFQKNTDNTPINFIVKDHTRAPRIVVGSLSASPSNYNLYVEPGTKGTNLGQSGDFSTYSGGYSPKNQTSFCTLTAAKLASTGCPVGTYLSQVFPGSSGDVAKCSDLTPQTSSYPLSNFNKGACK